MAQPDPTHLPKKASVLTQAVVLLDLDLDFDWLEFGLGLDFGCPDGRHPIYDQFTFVNKI